ncbi:MAG: hypothetical protein V2J25_15355 [Desulfatiglans sp.]|jgi:hypothetical protein|nr:hypothetical protein [Thermodesulfobacteriota bacterium]MEE4354237.1 hypothetical protein [Desulfatiglans sp.]
MLKQVVVFGIFLSLVVAVPASGRDMPAGKWWKNPRVIEHLQLSVNDMERLDQAFFNSRKNLIKLKSVLDMERLQLDNLLENEHLDEGLTIEAYRRVEKARTELAMEQFLFILETRKILGYERFLKIKAFRERVKNRMRNRHQ